MLRTCASVVFGLCQRNKNGELDWYFRIGYPPQLDYTILRSNYMLERDDRGDV